MAAKRRAAGQIPQANFVFQGTVKKTKASAMAAVKATAQTIVVRIDRLIQAPEALSDYGGQDVTVKLASGDKVKAGQTFVFFTHGWIFGEGLAVESVKLEPASVSAVAALSIHPDDPVKTLRTRAAKDQVAAADLVVTGRVRSIRLPERENEARATAMASGRTTEPISEHAPLWQEAIVDIDAVHKGQHSKKQVTIRFPASTDVRWRNAPKFHAGQEGVFLLHKQQLKATAVAMAAPALSQEEYTALDAADFQSLDNLPHLV